MRNLIDITDFTTEEIERICHVAIDVEQNPKMYARICAGKKLATLFFEPSTRTRLSFEAAMYELGGSVLSVTGANTSSAAKGESIADTARVVSNYADIIAMRTPTEGAALVAAMNANVPVINAGDGGHCHPTQTTADLLTIYKHKGKFDNLTIGVCGDLLYGRTVHSLMHAMGRYSNVKFICISPDELALPKYMKTAEFEIEETTSLEDALPELDVLYMTRIQRERFDDAEQYERLKNSYVLTPEKMQLASKDCIVLHPLPRVNEISVAVDKDPRALYFEQTLNGKLMRAAIIMMLLGAAENDEPDIERNLGKPIDKLNSIATESTASTDSAKTPKCENKKCITQTEQELQQRAYADKKDSTKLRCIYCDSKILK